MERKTPFVVDGYYHVYDRGVAKQPIFFEEKEKDRFQKSLYLCNTKKPVVFSRIEKEGYDWKRGDTIVDVVAYALMPNHFHLILHEKEDGGASKFVGKLLTSHSSYMNTKHERSGPLFCRPFRSKHVGTDEYFNWLLSYVHLNPLELHDRTWKEEGLANEKSAEEFLRGYKHSSFPDYYGEERPESKILAKEALPFNLNNLRSIDSFAASFMDGSLGEYEESLEGITKFLTK